MIRGVYVRTKLRFHADTNEFRDARSEPPRTSNVIHPCSCRPLAKDTRMSARSDTRCHSHICSLILLTDILIRKCSLKIYLKRLAMGDSWKQISTSAQQALLDSIPAKWRLPTRPDPSQTDVRSIPRDCGLLTQRQLEITDQNASELVPQLLAGSLSSVEVTEAFCARAAIAHQCVGSVEYTPFKLLFK